MAPYSLHRINMSWIPRLHALVACLCLTGMAPAQSPAPPQPTAITHVRLADDADAPQVSIVIENGFITQILPAGDELPPGLIEVDGGGALALPAFFDAYTVAGIETPSPDGEKDSMSSLKGNVHIGMREANRKGLQPAMRGVENFELSEDGRAPYRELGFALLHSSPSGEVLGGQTVLTTLGTSALRDRVVRADLFQTAAFRASGSGYPSTLMGYLAHLRQFMLDARRHELQLARVAAGKPDRRPPFDAEFEAMGPLLAGKQRLLCQGDSAGDILRWIKFAELQNIQIVIGGGGEAWRVTDELLAAKVPVLLGLDWGDEVDDPDEKEKEKAKEKAEGEKGPESESDTTDETPAESADPDAAHEGTETEVAAEAEPAVDESAEAASEEEDADESDGEPNWIYEEPIELRRERRRVWEERRDCALRLQEAGVPFAIGTVRQSPKALLENLRTLVELGLSEETALSSLTTSPAELMGSSATLGKLEVGYAGNVAVWSTSPWIKKSKLAWIVIDGESFEFEVDDDADSGAPAEGLDLTGEWVIDYDDQDGAPGGMTLTMEEDGALEGVLTIETPGGGKTKSNLSGQVSGHSVTLKGSMEMGNFSAGIRIEGKVEDDVFSGDATWKFSGGEDSNSFTATRTPKHEWMGHSHGNNTPLGGGAR
ncbi:MAG: imidazolonepropionase-like amidohydrolase [Candidatus Paceibacteria bacterium]